MIKDRVENSDIYMGIHPGIDKALESIGMREYLNWETGRHDIRGNEIFCLIQDYVSRTEGKIEAHNRYIDIQVVIKGEEHIGYAPRRGLEADGDFDEESDIGFFRGDGDPVLLREGEFAVFFPGDGHAPGLAIDNRPSDVRKAVYKIQV